MSFLSYGGVIIGLNGLAATERYERHPLIEGANYTARRHVITVRGYINPASISALPTANQFNQLDPTRSLIISGVIPPVTEVAIRFILEQPRQALLYVSGGTIVVQSPVPGATQDAAMGPFCKVNRIYPQFGEYKTWVIDATFETVVNDCPPMSQTEVNTLPIGATGNAAFVRLAQRVITSNVWQMTQRTNVDGLTIRETEGRTTFRTDELALNGLPGFNPDQFAFFFYPPVPQNCRREETFRQQTETNDALVWKIRDVELMNNVRGQGVTRVALKHRARIRKRDQLQFAWEMAETILDKIGQAIVDDARLVAQAGVANAAGLGPAVAALAFPGQIMQDIAAVSRIIRNSIPVVEIGVVVDVWGRRDCGSKALQAFAMELANARITFSLSLGARLLAGQDINMEVDCSEERHVRLTAVLTSTLSGFAYLFPSINGGLMDITPYFPNTDTTSTGGQNGVLSGTLSGISLPNDNGTRGSLWNMVQAPELTGPCATVDSPAQTAVAQFNPQIGPNPPNTGG